MKGIFDSREKDMCKERNIWKERIICRGWNIGNERNIRKKGEGYV